MRSVRLGRTPMAQLLAWKPSVSLGLPLPLARAAPPTDVRSVPAGMQVLVVLHLVTSVRQALGHRRDRERVNLLSVRLVNLRHLVLSHLLCV